MDPLTRFTYDAEQGCVETVTVEDSVGGILVNRWEPAAMAATTDSVRYTRALEHAANHRSELDDSAVCGCFFCFRTFTTSDIKLWIDKNQTALCPRCGIDAVIGTASGFTIDDRFLRKLNGFKFGARERPGR